MSSDHSAEPWLETRGAGRAPPPRRRRWPLLLAGGAAGALLLGIGAGLLVRPKLDNTDAAQVRAPGVPPGVPIEIARPVTELPPAAAGKLEVLPPGAASAAAAAPQLVPQAEAPGAPPAEALPGSPAAERAAPLVLPPPAPGLATRGACATGSPAAQMVCADPQLGEADRELNRAYRRALTAGVPQGVLRSEQRDWLAIREEAARRSPQAVADIYAQRIDELNAMADDARDAADQGPGF